MPAAPPSPDTAPAASPAGKGDRQGYGVDPVHAYGLMTPRFWHGMRPASFLRLLAAGGFAVSPRGAATCGTILGVGAFHAVGALAQSVLCGHKLDRVRHARPPLFVLGHWRSGTTLLHELLIRDDRHTYPTTYECFAPHHFLVTEEWVTPLIRWLLPKKRPMDNVATGWERPQEDEFALCSLGLPTPYRTWAFPRRGPVDADWLTLDGVDADRLADWKRRLDQFVRAVTLRRPGRRVVLKSPPHTARVRTLLEVFPDARFVHIVRDPSALFPSTVRLWKSLSDVQTLQWTAKRHDWIEEEVLANLVRMYEAYERDRDLIPDGRLAELRYEDLVADPMGELRRVYNDLDLGDFAAAEPGVSRYLAAERDYRTNRFEVPDDVRGRVAERWGAYAERWGYAA